MNTQDTSASPPIQIRPLRLRVDTQSEDVRIELVPMIDVIFCILTFFILAAVGFSRQQAISVDIPKARTGTPQGQEILMITLDQSGEVYVEKERMLRKEQFKRKLEAYRQQNPGGLMALYASENARYNQVVQVLDFLREVGGERVALATLAGESLPTTNQPTTQPPGTSVPGLDPNQQPGTSIPGITPPTPGTSIPGITPPTPGASIPGITPPTPGTSIPGITPPTSGTYPNQQPQGLPNFNGSSPGNPQQGLPNLNSPGTGNLQQSLPGDTEVSPNPSPTASPRKSNTLPES
ncbi:MAG: biopolymer transporter ExbD [Symploca sp. SIO2C1]|nr:biopolymer transporter ExbD [Symploca sp. SIO2C1]